MHLEELKFSYLTPFLGILLLFFILIASMILRNELIFVLFPLFIITCVDIHMYCCSVIISSEWLYSLFRLLRLSVYDGVFSSHIRRRLTSRLHFPIFQEAGHDRIFLVSESSLLKEDLVLTMT